MPTVVSVKDVNWIKFVEESNRIEGILRAPTEKEVLMTSTFASQDRVPTVESLSALALLFTDGRGKLRDKHGMDVRVGNHIAPCGGPHIKARLGLLLNTLELLEPYGFHLEYESLHPFLDGNGRTGRALWAWQMWHSQIEYLDLGFLHAFYYQTLAANARFAC